MSRVPVHMSCTTSYEPVSRRALDSWEGLAPGLPSRVHLDRYDLPPPDIDRLFKTDIWYRCLLRKCEYFLTCMREVRATAGEDLVAVYQDCDIAVYPALIDAWRPMADDMRARDLDCLFMREGTSDAVNGGLLIARSTRRMISFWQNIVDAFNADRTVSMGEQTLINDTLTRGDGAINWDYLPADRVVWGPPPSAGFTGFDRVCFHHAVCADGITRKAAQMDLVRAEVLRQQTGPPPLATGATDVTGACDAHIVLCRFSEPVACLAQWLGGSGGTGESSGSRRFRSIVYVYDRGVRPWAQVPEGVRHIVCPNLGREGWCYLRHIVDHYDALPQVVLFSQCDAPARLPLDKYLGARQFCSVSHNVGQGFLSATRWCEGEEQGMGYVQFPAGSVWWRAWNDGSMTRAKESIAAFYRRHVCAALPPVGRCVTTLTGTFAATRACVLSRPLASYHDLLAALSVGPDPEVGHYTERLWAHFFLGNHAALCVSDGVVDA